MVDWPLMDLPQARPIRVLSWNFYFKLELGKKKKVSLFLVLKVMTCDSKELLEAVSHSGKAARPR